MPCEVIWGASVVAKTRSLRTLAVFFVEQGQGDEVRKGLITLHKTVNDRKR
jgi:hypothetical protein